MFTAFKRRVQSALAAPGRSQFAHLDARADNIEEALHREVNALRQLVDERSFAIAELVVGTQFSQMQAATREHAEAAARVAASTAIEASREHAEAAIEVALRTSISTAQDHAEAAVSIATTSLEQRLAQLKIELSRTQRVIERLDRTGSVGAPQATVDLAPAATSKVDDLLYLAIEDRFRGDPADIRIRQERYVPFLPDCIDEAHPLLDLGCGRGEWLRVLSGHDVPARGIDSNVSCVDECRAGDLRADVGDLVHVLRASDDHSFGAVSMFHVVEHLPFDVLADVIRECARVLVPGGLLIVETPNALNLRVAATNFWLDPTHVRPLHPELLRLLADRGGFSRTQDLFLNEIGKPLELSGAGEVDGWLMELSRSLDGPGDYGLLAWTPMPTSDGT